MKPYLIGVFPLLIVSVTLEAASDCDVKSYLPVKKELYNFPAAARKCAEGFNECSNLEYAFCAAENYRQAVFKDYTDTKKMVERRLLAYKYFHHYRTLLTQLKDRPEDRKRWNDFEKQEIIQALLKDIKEDSQKAAPLLKKNL